MQREENWNDGDAGMKLMRPDHSQASREVGSEHDHTLPARSNQPGPPLSRDLLPDEHHHELLVNQPPVTSPSVHGSQEAGNPSKLELGGTLSPYGQGSYIDFSVGGSVHVLGLSVIRPSHRFESV